MISIVPLPNLPYVRVHSNGELGKLKYSLYQFERAFEVYQSVSDVKV